MNTHAPKRRAPMTGNQCPSCNHIHFPTGVFVENTPDDVYSYNVLSPLEMPNFRKAWKEIRGILESYDWESLGLACYVSAEGSSFGSVKIHVVHRNQRRWRHEETIVFDARAVTEIKDPNFIRRGIEHVLEHLMLAIARKS